jgi:feruloyl esterase
LLFKNFSHQKLIKLYFQSIGSYIKLNTMKSKKYWISLVVAFLVFGSHLNAQTVDSIACIESSKRINSLKIEGVTITAVQYISSGSFIPTGGTTTLNNLPVFCRIAATLKPTPASNIRIEVWLPCTNWNGRFLGTGNGGGAGSISYNPLAGGIRRGFATANTDMGTSPGAGTLIDQPEKWADFGYRATHEMTVVAKQIVQAFYQQAPHHTYFAGCSTGGQQAIMEAQRFPEDYNGILAGAPANNRTHLHTDFLLNYKATNEKPGTAFLPLSKLKFITDLVVKNCSGKDGGAPGDNFLTDPRACAFDPAIIPVCPEGRDSDSCLTYAQLDALKKMYAGPANPRTGERIYTSFPLGK